MAAVTQDLIQELSRLSVENAKLNQLVRALTCELSAIGIVCAKCGSRVQNNPNVWTKNTTLEDGRDEVLTYCCN